MAARKTNVEKLEAAGMLNSEQSSEAHLDAINQLSADEIAVLIKVQKKLGSSAGANAAAQQAGRPWCL
jgi:hypothetical protein